MKKLKQLVVSLIIRLDAAVKKHPRRILIPSSVIALIFLATLLMTLMVACEEDEKPLADNDPVVTTETTAATTEPATTTAPTVTTTADLTTELPVSTIPEEVPVPQLPPPSNDEMVFQKLNKTMYSIGNPVNVRESQSTRSDILGTIPYGGEVKVIGYNAKVGFYRVEYNGGVAYIVASYLSDTKPEQAQPKPQPEPDPQPPQPEPEPQPQPEPQPPQLGPPPQPVEFTRADMEELLSYGQGLGFGYTFITPTANTNEVSIAFSKSKDDKQINLTLYYSSPSFIRIGYADDAYATTVVYVNSVSSISEAKTEILNYSNW